LPVELAELAVLVARGFSFFVLLPQEHEGKLFVPGKFVMQGLPVGLGQLARRWIEKWRVQTSLKGFVIEIKG
jgi:hypothetical protein